MTHWQHGTWARTVDEPGTELNASSPADDPPRAAHSPGTTGGKDPGLAHAVAVARRAGWLASLPGPAAELLLRHARIQTFKRGQSLISVHGQGHPLYLLQRGVIEMSMPQQSDTTVPVRFLLSGEWFGEYGAITGAPSPAEYRARSAVAALAIPRANIAALSGHPHFHAAATELMAQSLMKATQQLADMMEKKPEDRIKAALLSLHRMTDKPGAISGIPISQDDLAGITCTSRITVNKVMRALIDEGILAARYRRIEVIRPEALLLR